MSDLLEAIHERALVDTGFAALVEARDTFGIAAALSGGRVRVVEHFVGIGAVLSTLGPESGVLLLDALQGLAATNRLVYWAWYLIERSTLDVGNALTRAQLDAFEAMGVVGVGGAAQLKALAERSDPIDEYDVRVALFAADGTYQG